MSAADQTLGLLLEKDKSSLIKKKVKMIKIIIIINDGFFNQISFSVRNKFAYIFAY